MATKKTSSKSDKSSSKSASSAKTKPSASSNVVANAAIVAAIRSFDESRAQTKSYLIELAEVIQNEQATKAEVVASIMVGRGVEKSTAETQYSRYKALFTDPDALEAARNGDVDVKELRKSKNPQKNPSAKKKQENNEKRFATLTGGLVKFAKESGTDSTTIINTIKVALKKAGVK